MNNIQLNTSEIISKAGNPNNGNNGNSGSNGNAGNNNNGNSGGNSNDGSNNGNSGNNNPPTIDRINFYSFNGRYYSLDVSLMPCIELYESDNIKQTIVLKIDSLNGNTYIFYATKNDKPSRNCQNIFLTMETFKTIVEELDIDYSFPDSF